MPSVNVLVVEDDAAVRQNLLHYLKELSLYTVDGSRDGVEALHQIAVRAYSVVVLDLMMPKMSGVDLLDSLEAMISDPSLAPPGSVPRIIVITGAPPEVLPSKYLEQRFPALVKAVLRKPVDIPELARLIEESSCDGH
jgi:CheY-like chemotaxis protein